MKQKKISIIIPVYNGGLYINRCIDSVLVQRQFDLNSLDVILINDGSRDGSLQILKDYESKYPGIIRVIDQENKGVANTRNTGIEQSLGEYIMFIDQDDYIDDDYCRVFYGAIESSGADVVSGGYVRSDNEGNLKLISSPRVGLGYSKYIIVAAWAKIHRASFLRRHKIFFFDNKIGEDSVFTVKEINQTNKWKQIEYNGYNWFLNEASVSNTIQTKLGKPEIRSLVALLDELSKSSVNSSGNIFNYYILRTCIYYLLFSGREATSSDFLLAYQEIKVYVDVNIDLMYLLSFHPKGEALSVKIIILIFILFHKTRMMGLFARLYCKG